MILQKLFAGHLFQSMCSRETLSFPDTKPTEYLTQQIVIGEFTGDAVQRIPAPSVILPPSIRLAEAVRSPARDMFAPVAKLSDAVRVR